MGQLNSTILIHIIPLRPLDYRPDLGIFIDDHSAIRFS